MIKVGIIGGAGYTAGELLRILVHHPQVEIVFVNSSSNAGNAVSSVHSGLFGECDLNFTDELPFEQIDVLFICSGHGDSRKFIEAHELPASLKIIDLSTDYRDESDGFVYGLPEYQRNKIQGAQKIANPGCFATCIQLAFLPLAHAQLLKNDIHVTAITGSTGAGVKPSATTHFSWRNDNISVYKAFSHQHLIEITQTIKHLQPAFDYAVNFVPMRGDFARGIFASVYTECDLSEEEAIALYKDYYKDAAFTFVSDSNIDMKQVVNTNKALVYVRKYGKQLHILSAIDNLAKGASGQAVQNMNLIFGLDETCGLGLKSIGF